MNRHAFFVKLGLDTTPKIATQLLTAYAAAKSPQSLSSAHQLFDQVSHRDPILWSSLISAYARSNLPHKALQLFSLYTLEPNPFIFATVARAICDLPDSDLRLGRTLHARVVKHGFMPNNVVVGTAYLDMYGKCGDVGCALKVFDEMLERNLVTWNAMVAGCVNRGMVSEGLELFYRMKCGEFFMPDEFSVSTVLVGCGSVQNLRLGRQLHSFLTVSGLVLKCVDSLCNMYFQCGEVVCAERVVEEMGFGFSSGLSLIRVRGYVMNHCYKKALQCLVFESNAAEIFEADHSVIVPLLTACARLSFLGTGQQLHGLLVTSGRFTKSSLPEEDDEITGCALIDMYSKCCRVSSARMVFDDRGPCQKVSQWNSMINGYVYNGLVDEARALFEDMPEKNVVCYTSLMLGYVQNDKPSDGLKLLARMYSNEDGDRIEGNSYTFVVGLDACTRLADLNRGKQIHGKIIRCLTSADVCNPILGTALVDTYGKAASLRYAKSVFDSVLEKNVISWTSIITAYAHHGDGLYALALFRQMIDHGVEPNEVTFVSVLSACSHCGLIEEGLDFFKLMVEKYGLVPREDHYTCLVDMLGRVGRLGEAWKVLEGLAGGKMNESSSILAAMAGACQLHGDVDLGRKIAEKMLEKKEKVGSTHIALSNVYASAGLWQEAFRTREMWRNEGSVGSVDSEPGLSRVLD